MKWPRIMICLLTKNDAKYLPRFLATMNKLDYPKTKLRWVWIYGKSKDNTLQIILDFHKKHSYKYEVYEEFPIHMPVRSSLYVAELCNAFKELYKDEEYVLFADTDVVQVPRNTLKEMVKVNKDIVAPYVYIEGTKQFFDTYVFRINGYRFDKVVLNGKVYDSLNPPFKDEKKPVELDSVGTFILIKGEVFKRVRWENPAPHLQFCKNARKLGYKVYALPYIKIYHANVLKEGEYHLPVEYYVQRGVLPESELEKVGYVRRGDKWVLDTK